VTRDRLTASILRPALVETLFVAFQRVIGAYCLLFGIFYWIRLIGLYPGELWRFDTMPVEWQIASVSLAALFPVAGIGLWMTASWGPVIWFLCAGIELVMYAGLPEIFGSRHVVIASYALVALVYVGFRVALALQAREAGR
jgi:hypothetical protein